MNIKSLLLCLIILPSYSCKAASCAIEDWDSTDDRPYWSSDNVGDLLDTYRSNKPYLGYGSDEWGSRKEEDYWGAKEADYEFDMFSVDAFGKG